eukprot:CAMPEP_0172389392 /NCGR_PEP_ID=MMETSP1061-20121228/6285_1 /TAXON_ID=37318 /ORGANISM="Pseudo-nitzschia pungens, Strain cf. pungens" /LENGTH=309 /DNA_ID=CAMNT_0013119531 /DNA_START=288 /DNA_END=1217 /DNA_ORIENTATION=+
MATPAFTMPGIRRACAVWTILASSLVLCVSGDDTSSSSSSSEYLNVYGEPLQPCSQDGMALTGYTRSGYCVDRWNDQGSHHVCIDLSSLGNQNQNQDDNNNNNNNYNIYGNDDASSSSSSASTNFCTVTGQSDWCSKQDMPCHSDPSDYSCPVQDWCVCQWAFSSYVKASGCENIQTVVCESVNLQAVLAYQNEAAKWGADQKYQTALDCLVEKCGLDADSLYAYAYTYDAGGGSWSSQSFHRASSSKGMFGAMVVLVGVGVLVAVLVLIITRRRLWRGSARGANPNDDGIVLGAPVPSGFRLLNDETL